MAVLGSKSTVGSVGDIWIDTAGDRTPWRVASVNSHGEAEWVRHSAPDVAKATGVSEHDVALLENAYAAAIDNHVKVDDSVSALILAKGSNINFAQGLALTPLGGGLARVCIKNDGGGSPTLLAIGDYQDPNTAKSGYIAASVTNGGRSITAAGHNLEVGDMGLLISDDTIDTVHAHLGDETRPLEMFKVRRVNGDVIWTEKRIEDTHTVNVKLGQMKLDGTGDNATSAGSRIERIDFRNSDNGPTSGSSNTQGIMFYTDLEPIVKDCIIEHTGHLGFQFCYGWKVLDCDFGKMNNPERHYGIVPTCADAGRIERCRFSGQRHAFTNGAEGGTGADSGIRWGTNSDIKLIDCTAYWTGLDDADSATSAFSEHPEALGLEYIRCTVICAGDISTIGFTARGRATRYEECKVIGAAGGLTRAWQMKSAPDVTLVRCEAVNCLIAIELEPYDGTEGEPDSHRLTLIDFKANGITTNAVLLDGGDGHYISGEFIDCGSAEGTFVGDEKAAITLMRFNSDAEPTNITFGKLVIDKVDNDYSIFFNNVDASQVTFESAESEITGWDRLSIGFDRSNVNTALLERKYHDAVKTDATLRQATSHTLDFGDDPYVPVVVSSGAFSRYDDTEENDADNFVGVLVDMVDGNWIWVAAPGQRFTVPVAMLENSASPDGVGEYLRLYWDDDQAAGGSAGGFTRTEPADSAASNKPLAQAIEIGTSDVELEVLPNDQKESYAANVRDYGADPTGVTESTAAIQAAIDTGLPVYAPKGDYLVGTLDVPSNTTIYGDGMYQTVFHRVNRSGDMFDVEDQSNIHLHDFGITYDSLNADYDALGGFPVEGGSGTGAGNASDNVVIERLHIFRVPSVAIACFGGSEKWVVKDCHLEHIGRGGVVTNGGRGWIIANNRIEHTGDDGIATNNLSRDCTIDGNVLVDCGGYNGEAICTFDSTTDTFTSTDHGYSNADRIWLTGPALKENSIAMPTGYRSQILYYVVNATDNTFQLSLTSGGAVVDGTTDGGTVYAYVRFENVASGIKIHGRNIAVNSNTMYRCYKGIELRGHTDYDDSQNDAYGAPSGITITGNTVHNVSWNDSGSGESCPLNIIHGDKIVVSGNTFTSIEPSGYVRAALVVQSCGQVRFSNNTFNGRFVRFQGVSPLIRDLEFAHCTFNFTTWGVNSVDDTPVVYWVSGVNADSVRLLRCGVAEASHLMVRTFGNNEIRELVFEDSYIVANDPVAQVGVTLDDGVEVTSIDLKSDLDYQPGPTIRIPSGQELWLTKVSGGQISREKVTVSSDCLPGDTSISINSFTPTGDYTAGQSWLTWKKIDSEDDYDSYVYTNSGTTIGKLVYDSSKLPGWQLHNGAGTLTSSKDLAGNAIGTLADGDTTPSVADLTKAKSSASGATNRYGLDDVEDGKTYTLILNSNDTLHHSDITDAPDVTFDLAGDADYTPSGTAVVTVLIDGSVAREVSRAE